MTKTDFSLNPYYTGILYTRQADFRRLQTELDSLNPYYTGILYTSQVLPKTKKHW